MWFRSANSWDTRHPDVTVRIYSHALSLGDSGVASSYRCGSFVVLCSCRIRTCTYLRQSRTPRSCW